MKKCTTCLTEQTFEAFHKDASRKDGHRELCKACVALYMRKNYVANKDAIVEKANKWVSENRERHNAKCNLWAKNNPGKVNARTARRYAAKTQATPKWLTADDHWMISEAYDLAQLRTKMFGVLWEVDHIVPLRGKMVSGLHAPWNLQVVPAHLNRRKSNKFETVQ
jgi:hypothetical protein